MAEDGKQDEPRGLDRRSVLIGGAAGAAVTAAGAAGANALRDFSRSVRTPTAADAGRPAEIAESFADSRPAYEAVTTAKPGAPNIIVIVLDDVGFADLGCYGSEIATPAIDGLAAGGILHTNFRTCAMCSPTRAALMTGLNHHSAGMGWLADIDSGYPGYRGDMTLEAATLAEVLNEAGWSTFHVGKWHVNLAESNGPNGPYHNWPTSRGFERAYWFQGHSTDYFKPSALYEDRALLDPPADPDYFISDDLTDRAIAYIQTQKALAPDKPFYLQLCYPATHSPLQARPRDRDRFKGAYDPGWDEIRRERLEKQKRLGLMPAHTRLPPLSPGAEPWTGLSPLQKRVYARYMEVYAGMIANVDANIGRLLDCLKAKGLADQTMVLLFSDNGGSAEGSPTGTPNIFAPVFGRPVSVDDAAKFYDSMGEDPTFPHYPIGWACASNTPFRMYKQYTHLGGIADPLIISWPGRIKAQAGLRTRFVHVIDLYPTILQAAGIERPAYYRGRKLKPLEGVSVLDSVLADAPVARDSQYYELGGQRAFTEGDWRLVTRHERGKSFDADRWELYDMSKDPNELDDLARQNPDKVKELARKWHDAAIRFGVLPLDDRNFVLKMVQERLRRGIRDKWSLKPPLDPLPNEVAPVLCGFSHRIDIELTRPEGAGNGVLLSHGSKPAGFVLHIMDDRLIYEQSLLPWLERIEFPVRLDHGRLRISYVQTMTSRPFDGKGQLFVNGKPGPEHVYQRVLFSTSYDHFAIGSDPGNQVSSLYRGSNPFRGEIGSVDIFVDNAGSSPIETMRFMNTIGIRI